MEKLESEIRYMVGVSRTDFIVRRKKPWRVWDGFISLPIYQACCKAEMDSVIAP